MKFMVAIYILSGSLAVACDSYKDLFDRGIYDQTNVSSGDATKALCQNKIKLLKQKKIAPLERQIVDNQDLIRSTWWSCMVPGGVAACVGVAVAIIVHPLLGTSVFLMACVYTGKNGFQRMRIYKVIDDLSKEKTWLLENVNSGDLYELEKYYVNKKNSIPHDWHEQIETSLLSVYKTGLKGEDKRWLTDLVHFPIEKWCLSKNGEKTPFGKALKDSHIRLKKALPKDLGAKDIDSCVYILNSIAKASKRSFSSDEDSRAVIYICTSNAEKANKACKAISKTLKLSHFAFDAAKSELSDDLLRGREHACRGVLLEPFLAGPKAKRVLNPVLIIGHADLWILELMNHALLLKIFDKNVKTFHSNYFDRDIDLSMMSIICAGEQNPEEFDPAIKSRLECYRWTDN